MKVILLQSTKNLGQKGEVVEVSEGHFRNFLLPRKLAIVAAERQVAHIQAQKDKSKEKLEMMKESAHSIRSKLDGKSLVLREKAGETGTLYRTINEKIISEAIEKSLSAQIPASCVELDGHIKALGTYKVNLNLYKDIKATINLEIAAI